MTNEFLPFSKPTIDQATIDEVVSCLKSGWITTGPRVQKFASMLKEYLGAKHALPLLSGTAGLQLSLMSLNLKPEDEVIVPAFTFIASANTVVHAGAKPVFVDVDLATRNITAELIEPAITKKTRAIMPVHFAGLSVDLDPIYALAKKYNLRVIEDAAQAIGATYKNKKIGSFGDTQVFSFHPNKNMTTGEGGCVTTSDDEIAHQIEILRFHGIDRTDAWNRFSKSGSQHYDVSVAGFKYNMMDIQAALGLHQLPQLDEFNQCRTQLAHRYLEKLKSWPQFDLPEDPTHYEHNNIWHLFNPLLNLEQARMTRDIFLEKMKDKNIGIGFHYDAVHLFSYYQKTFGYEAGDFPNTENIASRIMSLPLFPTMTESIQDHVIDTMQTVFEEALMHA